MSKHKSSKTADHVHEAIKAAQRYTPAEIAALEIVTLTEKVKQAKRALEEARRQETLAHMIATQRQSDYVRATAHLTQAIEAMIDEDGPEIGNA